MSKKHTSDTTKGSGNKPVIKDNGRSLPTTATSTPMPPVKQPKPEAPKAKG